MGWFRRRPCAPAPAPIPDPADIRTAHAWGLNLDQWAGLTDFERAECRRHLTNAPRFEVTV